MYYVVSDETEHGFNIQCAFIYYGEYQSGNTCNNTKQKLFRNNTNKNTNKIGNMVKKYQCNTFKTI